MSDHIDRAAEVIERASEIVSGAMFGLTTPSMVLAIVTDLYAHDLLASPEHDAAVAARALRQVADALDAEDSNEWANDADWEAVRIIGLIRDRADLYERDGATS